VKLQFQKGFGCTNNKQFSGLKFTNSFQEMMTNAKTYTDIVITEEPANDLSPLASWPNLVAQTLLMPPFGQ
jgi:hypothetical protein